MEVFKDIAVAVTDAFRQLQRQPTGSQITLGAIAGFAAALASLKVLKTVAFIAGGSMLLSTTLTELRWNPELNFDFNHLPLIHDLGINFTENTFLGSGFIGGYLLGFAYS